MNHLPQKTCPLLFVILLFVLMVGGCDHTPETVSVDEDLLGSGVERGSDKIVVTISNEATVVDPMPLTNFKAAVERRFPDVLLLPNGYAGGYQTAEHLARVRGGDLSDIVMVKAGRKPLLDLTTRLLDLSTRSFPGAYNSNILEKTEEGRVYFIPGPLNLNGIIYNKTLFAEKGWAVPRNYEEWLTLAQHIDATGVRGFLLPLQAADMPLYAFTVRVALDTLTNVAGQNWYRRLLAGDDVDLSPLGDALAEFARLRDHGLHRPEDMTVDNGARMTMLADRSLAMSPGETGNLLLLTARSRDKFAFMPHFSGSNGSGWLLNLGFYYGANKRLSAPGQEKKLRAVMDILAFLATDEGQQALIADKTGILSSVRGARVPDAEELADIRDLVIQGHYVMRPVFHTFASVLNSGMAAYLRKETDAAPLLEDCRNIMRHGVPEPEPLAQAAMNFTVVETAQCKADALRAAVQADVALIGMAEVNGAVPIAGTRSKFYAGPVTMDDVLRVAQLNAAQARVCCRATITGQTLLDLLEHGAVTVQEQRSGSTERFHPFAVSGLSATYTLSAPKGRRVSGVKLVDGSPLAPDRIYTLAYLRGTLPDAPLLDEKTTDIFMADALADRLRAVKTLAPDPGRIAWR